MCNLLKVNAQCWLNWLLIYYEKCFEYGRGHEWSKHGIVLQTISGNKTVPLMESFRIVALNNFKGCYVCNELIFTISVIDMNRAILE